MTACEGDDALDLGEIEAGEHPGKRTLKPGAHPWAPSALDDWVSEVRTADTDEA